MQRDKFNRPVESIHYGKEDFVAVEWDSTSSPGVVYLRGDYDDVCIIQKVDTNSGTITWGFGSWENRLGLSYGSDRLIRG